MASRVVPVTLGVQAVTFASSVAVASVFGATYRTDAYYIALAIALLIYWVVLTALRLGSIPALTELRSQGDKDFAAASSELIPRVLLTTSALSVATTGLAVAALPLLIGDGDPRTVPLARLLVVELAPLTVLGSLTGVLGGILSAAGRFVAPVAVLIFDPFLRAILTVALGPAIGVQALVLANVVGSTIAVTVLGLLVRRLGVSFQLISPSRGRFVRRVLTFSVPLMIGQGVLTFNPLIDRVMASALAPGRVTVFEFGSQVFNVPTVLIGSTLIAPLAAIWAGRYAEGGWPALRASISTAFGAAAAVLPPVVVLGFLLRHDIVVAIYQGGAFNPDAVTKTASVFGMLMLGLPAQMLILLYATLFLVRKNSIVPMLMGIANVVLNVSLNFVLRGPLDVAGIALSTSITLTLLGAGYVFEAKRRFGTVISGSLKESTMRALVSTVMMALAAWALSEALPDSDTRLTAVLVILAVGGVTLTLHTVLLVVTGDRYGALAVTTLRRLFRASTRRAGRFSRSH